MLSTRTRNSFVLIALLAYLSLEVFSGPLRMTFGQLGLSPLIYLPKLSLGVATGWVIITEPYYKGISHRGICTVLLIGMGCAVGALQLGAKQVAIGLWVLLPFWFGLVCAGILKTHLQTLLKLAPFFWLCAFIGVTANYFITWPWEGYGYSVAGMDVEGSRKWWASGGIKRIAGFSRSSFDAAVQLVILGALAVIALRSWFARCLLWVATAVAIYLTTSKGIFLVYLIITPIIFAGRALPSFVFAPLPLVLGLIGLPLLTLAYSFVPDASGSATLVNALYSFYDRLNYMWPEAWALLHEHGNAWLGRGLGGIGTAQTYLEPLKFNAADNLYMYWIVVFGWISLPVMLALLLATLRLRPARSQAEHVHFTLLVATLVYGLTTNIVENAAFAIVAGTVISLLASSHTHKNKLPSTRRQLA